MKGTKEETKRQDLELVTRLLFDAPLTPLLPLPPLLSFPQPSYSGVCVTWFVMRERSN